jgi:hypothetical protein
MIGPLSTIRHIQQRGSRRCIVEGPRAGVSRAAYGSHTSSADRAGCSSWRALRTSCGVDESKFLLVNRGFHWINEFPFNR